jgi:hypothetical protein
MENIAEHITAAFNAVQESHEEYAALHAAYVAAMASAGGYESTGTDEPRADIALSMIEAGELTAKGIARAVDTGLIRKITAKKSDELLAAEVELQKATNAYHQICVDLIAPFQFKKTRSRSHGETTPGEIGANKKADVTAIIRGIDSGAVIEFSGRRVFGSLSNGATFDYDAYGQSYPAALAKMMTH